MLAWHLSAVVIALLWGNLMNVVYGDSVLTHAALFMVGYFARDVWRAGVRLWGRR